MARHPSARFAMLVCAVLLLSVPGCGGGGGGGGLDEGPAYWAIPLVPTSAGRAVNVGMRNLSDSSATAAIQGYRPDGTAYPAAPSIALDGGSERIVSLATALGAAAAGGVVYVTTPSRRVEVWYDVDVPADDAAEASRAIALPDLASPPPGPFRSGVNATTLTTSIQIANASGVPAAISVTAFEESLIDPLAPPVAQVIVLAGFAAGESRVFTPDSLSGVTGFVGSFLVESPQPVVAAAEEDLAFDLPRVVSSARVVAASVAFGRDPSTVNPSYLDFALVVRNDGDAARTVQLTAVNRRNGVALLSGARFIDLAAHESRAIPTTEAPLGEFFGDVLAASEFDSYTLEMQVPAGVDVGLRQFEHLSLAANMTIEPAPFGHVVMVSDVRTLALLPSPTRTFATVYNPNEVPIPVDAEAVVTQPTGFDAAVVPVATLTVPAHGQIEISTDGVTYLDRDLVAVSAIGLRFRSDAAFGVTARRVTRLASNAVVTLVPLPVRSFDDGE